MKQFSLILMAFICYLASANAQKPEGQALLDSMLAELPMAKEDTNKVNLLNDLSWDYAQINPDEGIKYGLQGLALAEQLGWKKGIAKADNNLGNNYQSKSDYPKALEYYFKSLKMNEALGDKGSIARITRSIGNVYSRQSDYAKALEYYFKVLKMKETLGDKDNIARTIGNIGLVYAGQGDYPKALKYHSKALKMYEELGNKSGIARTTSNIGNVYSEQSNYPQALKYYFKSLKIFEELGDKQGIAMTSGNIGLVCGRQSDYTQAVDYFQSSLQLAKELGDKYMMALSLNNIGSAYIAIIGKPRVVSTKPEIERRPAVSIPAGREALLAAAIDHLQRGLAICKEIEALDRMMECYAVLSEAYKLKGDYKKSLEMSDNFHAIKDSVFSQENKEEILKMGMKNEYERQRLRDSLKTAEKQKIAAINLKKQKNYTYMGIVGILLLAGFSFFIVKERDKSETARKQSDELLLNILPEEVAAELKTTGGTTAKHYDNVTVLFTDFVDFTKASEKMTAQNLIDELHTCFKAFDAITSKYGIEKIKTIGDAYLAVCGLPTADGLHAEKVVSAAQDIKSFMLQRREQLGDKTFEVRIGIHSGEVVAGIVGVKKFAYDIWGDTVNTAARMEQKSEAGKINISQTTYELVKDRFACTYRGEIEAKNKGMMKMYFVEG
jgi:adenylate cyclase